MSESSKDSDRSLPAIPKDRAYWSRVPLEILRREVVQPLAVIILPSIVHNEEASDAGKEIVHT
ncbi:MAG: hypothetical protein IT364_03360 [Candidatus Hydrogenedentes bacterium]|nr:hypothetical protein [Candidatus Hydrogenedentota bacterium]